MDIIKKLIKYNTSSRQGVDIKYIVIHDTGNAKKGANANNHFLYFNGGNRNASAHYFVDDKEILQLVEDNVSAWHVGDGKAKYGITNANSIGIEICVNEDGNYLMAVQNTIELTKQLMDKHNIPLDRVIRHFDASKKICPRSMSSNNWEGWRAFKIALEREVNKVATNKVKVNVKGRMLYLDGIFQNDKNYISVRELAEALGYNVGWDNVNKIVLIE